MRALLESLARASLALAAISPAACGPAGGQAGGAAEAAPATGSDTIEGLFVKLTIAVNDRNGDLIVSLLPPADLMAEVMDCPGPNPLVPTIDKVVSRMGDLMAKMEASGVSLEFEEITVLEEGTKEFAVGHDLGDGCLATVPITMRKVSLVYYFTRKGEVTKEAGKFTVVRFGKDGPWYIVGPS